VSDGTATAALTISVTVDAVPDQLSVPTGLAWDGTIPGKAKWGEVTNASSYSVQLKKDGINEGNPVAVSSGTECLDYTSVIEAAADHVIH
jgi:hypothetical protein